MPRTSKEITIKKLLEFASTYIVENELNKNESKIVLEFIKYIEINRNK